MLIKSENHSHFKRKGNVITELLSTGEETPVLFFKQNFIDSEMINQTTIDYLNRYISMFPHLVEKLEAINTEAPNDQLTLF